MGHKGKGKDADGFIVYHSMTLLAGDGPRLTSLKKMTNRGSKVGI